MILTKEEFKEEFGYNSLPAVHRLIRENKIKIEPDGNIDTNAKENKEWCLKRREKIGKKTGKGIKEDKTADNSCGAGLDLCGNELLSSAHRPRSRNQKPEAQLNLELDILSEKYEQAQKRNRLLDLKITKEQGDTVSTDILNRCIVSTFDEMFKSLTDIPNVYASELVYIVQSSETPKEAIAEYLTAKIVSALKSGLDCARKTAKKYYEKSES